MGFADMHDVILGTPGPSDVRTSRVGNAYNLRPFAVLPTAADK